MAVKFRVFRYHVAYWVRVPRGEWTPAWAQVTLPHPVTGPDVVREMAADLETRWAKTTPGTVIQVHSWQRYESPEG